MSTNSGLSPHHHQCLIAQLPRPPPMTNFGDHLRQPTPVTTFDSQLWWLPPTAKFGEYFRQQTPTTTSNDQIHLRRPTPITTACSQLQQHSTTNIDGQLQQPLMVVTPPISTTIILSYDYYKFELCWYMSFLFGLCWYMSFLFCWCSWHKIVNKTLI